MKTIQRLTLCAIFALSSLYASAYDFEVDGKYYNYVDKDAYTCEVTYYSLYSIRSSYANTDIYTGSVSIPETVNYNEHDYTVVCIGQNAFYQCSKMTEITIPATVTSIDSLAFNYCSALTEITIPRTVTSIGGYAFYQCSSIKEVEIPNGVDIIHTYTFYGCSNLEKVTIPSSVTSIWGFAFNRCSSLSDVTIPSSVTSIGDRAFSNCSKLATVTLEDGEETLAMTTSSSYTPFYNCSTINTLYLGRNISYTGSYSPFREKTTLSELTIGNSVTALGTYAFYGCTALEKLEFPSSLMEIGTYAFYNCSSLTELTIPDNVTSLGTYAFYGCSGLTDIIIGSGVTSIGSYTFYNCKPEEIYFFARLSDYYLVFTGLNCGTLYAHEDQIDAIKAEYSGTVLPLEDVYSLSAQGTYPRSIALKANVDEKLMVDGVSLKSVTVGRNELSESNGLYIAKNLIPNQTYTCTLTFLYDNQERTDQIEVTTEDFCKEATLQSSAPTSLTFAISLNEDAYSSLPDEYGLMYDGTSYPADEDGKVTISGLNGSTEYTFDLYATYDGSTIKGESVTATTLSLTAPTVTTSSATDVTDTSATLNGSVTAGNEDILEKGFEYWTTQDDITTVVATEDFSVTLTNLTPGTTYTYRAYVKTDSGTTYGEEMTFTTIIVNPTVQTVSATDITHNSATLTATITAGSEEIEEQGFEYRPSSASSSNIQTITGSGEEMVVTLTGLTANTTYLYCAYAKTATKTTYGEEKAFTTITLVAPTVQTNAATNITTTSATLNGSLTVGSEEIEEKGFEYWATSGDDTDTHTTLADDNMSATITGLTPSMMYLFRAYVKTESGTTYGSAMSFTTEAEVIVPPTVQTFEATQITATSAQLVGFVTAGSEEIQEVGFEYWLSSNDKQTVTASGEYISVVVENLESSATYTYRAYAKTESTTTYGDSVTFTTLFDPNSAKEDLSDEIEDAKKELEDVWDYIVDNYPDIADEFKDEYDELMGELEDLLKQLEDAYNNGTLTEELVNEIRAKIEEIMERIKQMLEDAKQKHEFPYDFLVDGIYYKITSSSSLTVEAMYGLTSSPYSDIIIIPSTVTNENVTYAVTSVGGSPFPEGSITSITLPSSITSVGEGSFSNCSSLTTVVCEWDDPSNVSVSESSFNGVYSTATLYVPNGTSEAYQSTAPWSLFSSIEEYDPVDGTLKYNISNDGTASVASYQSTDISGDIVVPENVISEGIVYKVTTLGNYAFNECRNIINVSLPDCVTRIGDYSFRECNNMVNTPIPSSVTYIGAGAFQGCYSITSAVIPYGINEIRTNEFYFCTSLADVTLPETVSSINGNAFGYCAFTNISIPDAVTYIGDYTFQYCPNLSEITIPDKVTTLDIGAVRYCMSLKEVTLGESVKTLKDYVFVGCENLEKITSLNPEPPTCGEYVFHYVDTQTCILYVPKGAKEAYSSADTWKDFYNIVELGSSDGIESVTTDEKEVEGVYNLSGVRVNTPIKDNVYILRYSDGTTKKVMMK